MSGQLEYVLYHQHTGGSGGGGCYTVSHQGSSTVAKCHDEPNGEDTDGIPGNEWHSVCDYHTEHYTYYTLGCGMTPDTYVRTTTDWDSITANERIYQAIITY
ncbi:hypothetical protein [Butyrivibrio proteoclasticus]|uniref:hypothetical protein n=1 Tax=Butyrivibrio proteoclasticus TaxID=43305 RepID=UPI0012DDD615|nr:hypothetical protein [Butyrivibrio proteoclasticus]